MPDADAWVQMHREMREDIRALRRDVTDIKVTLAANGVHRKPTVKEQVAPATLGGTIGALLLSIALGLYEYLTKN